MKTTQLNFSIPEDQKTILKAILARQGVSLTKLLTTFVQDYIEKHRHVLK